MNEETREKLAEISRMLEERVKDFRTSEMWLKHLEMQARLPHYSFNNCILIELQTQGKATMCQSFTGWKAMGGSVKKSEKGLKIICPAPRKVYTYETKRDENGNEIRAADGTVEKEKVCHVQQSYKVGYTFDVSQVDITNLPEICTRLDGSVEGAEDLIGILQEISPVPIAFDHINGTANGYFSPSDLRIVVDEDLSPNHKIHTCLHEMAHATLNLSGEDNGASRELKETEAESIAFVTMKHLLGDKMTAEDIGQYSFGYINNWASSDDLTEMKTAMATIQWTSAALIDKIEAVYRDREKLADKESEEAVEAQVIVQHKGKHM
ncbi:MAG: ssDNA-binding domain-containing protein [Lachnospiraceae bacterium]|nr:ssDNA-binding domain-containing protein [Lachnospiraceae bacterium]